MSHFFQDEKKVKLFGGLLLLGFGSFLLYLFYFPPEPVTFEQVAERLWGKEMKVERKREIRGDRDLNFIEMTKKRLLEGRARVFMIAIAGLIWGLYLILNFFEDVVDDEDTDSPPGEE